MLGGFLDGCAAPRSPRRPSATIPVAAPRNSSRRVIGCLSANNTHLLVFPYLDLRSESGALHQQHGKEAASENVERKAEAGPPYRNTWILNKQVMKEVENPVSGEGSHNQPKVLLEACNGQREKSACYQGLQGQRLRGSPHDRKQNVIGGNHCCQRRIEYAVAIKPDQRGEGTYHHC